MYDFVRKWAWKKFKIRARGVSFCKAWQRKSFGGLHPLFIAGKQLRG